MEIGSMSTGLESRYLVAAQLTEAPGEPNCKSLFPFCDAY